MTSVFVPKEIRPGETRVAATPETVKRFAQAGLALSVERGAGARAHFADSAYEIAGAKLCGPEQGAEADLVLKVAPPTGEELGRWKRGAVIVSFLYPARNPTEAAALVEQGFSHLAMDLIPRITRAQSMDALSSQATVAGYKAVLVGAAQLSKLCPLLMTAAGTVPPAKCVVFGAGVAGLQAIATARRLGCIVDATDVRLATREQVLSLGARFIDVPGMQDMEGAGGYAKEAGEEFLRRQREEVQKRVAEADLVITTALVPGKKAPILVTAAMVQSMKPGSVIVDMATDAGGNCELSVPDQIVERHGVILVGTRDLAASVPQHASELYAKNVLALVKLCTKKDSGFELALGDEVIAGALYCHQGALGAAKSPAKSA